MINEDEKKRYIEYMLQNDIIEEVLLKWNKSGKSEDLCRLIETIAVRTEECGGLILAVESDVIRAGVENIIFFTGTERGSINRVTDSEGNSYAMVFTSKEKFQACNDTSGFVMFIDDVIELIESNEVLNGMIINFGTDDVIFDKFMMKIVLWLIRQS